METKEEEALCTVLKPPQSQSMRAGRMAYIDCSGNRFAGLESLLSCMSGVSRDACPNTAPCNLDGTLSGKVSMVYFQSNGGSVTSRFDARLHVLSVVLPIVSPRFLQHCVDAALLQRLLERSSARRAV